MKQLNSDKTSQYKSYEKWIKMKVNPYLLAWSMDKLKLILDSMMGESETLIELANQKGLIKAEKMLKNRNYKTKTMSFKKVLNFKKAMILKLGNIKLFIVNLNKYGVPISLTLEGDRLIKGIDDKISLFGGKIPY